MRIKTQIVSLVAATALVVWGCTKDNGVEGPLLQDLYGDFSLVNGLESSREDVDFSAGESIYFTAEFSKSTDWELHIVGLESGAEKVITGKSRMLEQSNATWDGSTSEFPLFREELVEVRLWVPEDTLSLYDTVEVMGVKVIDGFTLLDFEDNTVNPLWDIFVQSGANMSFIIDDSQPAAQGRYYYDMGGEVNWDWLIGYFYVPSSSFPDSVLNGGTTLPLSGNPNNMFLNMALYSPEGINNELLLIRINEDDNMDGSFNAANEDQYAIEIRDVDNEKWSLLSLRYADLTALVNGAPVEPAGNGLREPDKIHQVEFLFLANPSSGYSQMYLDYVIFTEGGPLEP